MKESLQMLSMARRQGITDVFATSHYSKAFPNRDPEKLRQLRDELMRSSQSSGARSGGKGEAQTDQFEIWTGQEIFYSNSVIRLLEEGQTAYVGRQQLRAGRVYASRCLIPRSVLQ